jgi:hypothetical protein
MLNLKQIMAEAIIAHEIPQEENHPKGALIVH